MRPGGADITHVHHGGRSGLFLVPDFKQMQPLLRTVTYFIGKSGADGNGETIDSVIPGKVVERVTKMSTDFISQPPVHKQW